MQRSSGGRPRQQEWQGEPILKWPLGSHEYFLGPPKGKAVVGKEVSDRMI